MRKMVRSLLASLAVATALIPLGSGHASAAPNVMASDPASASQLINGDFDSVSTDWASPWILHLAAPAMADLSQDTATFVTGPASARVTVTTPASSAAWNVQLRQGNLSLVAGTAYSLSFWAKSSAGQAMMPAVQQTISPWVARAAQWYTLTSSWQHYSLTFTAPATEGNIAAEFNLGAGAGSVWLDGVTFTANGSAPTPTTSVTPVPPTSTATLAPPTATQTPVPPTATAPAPITSVPGSVQDYPRLANLQGYTGGAQAATFARYGLVLARLSPKSANVAASVQALKSKSPGTKVLFYLETLSVDVPGFNGMSIYPGWWLTLAGTTLSAPLDATSTTVHVANAALINASLGSNPDVLVDGESMHVNAVDVSAGTLSVQRGYNSSAAVHASGARLAAHASKWAGSWMLNLSTSCPLDPASGLTWGAYLLQQARADFAAAAWDGVWYDDSYSSVAFLAGGQIDANNDNVADGGNGTSGTGWSSGTTQLFAQSQSQFPSALILGNGDVFPATNGQELEHFPFYTNGWANGLSTYLNLAGPGGTASSSIINADTANTGVQQLASMRFNLGTALLGNGYYSYDGGTATHGQTWWYDEYDNGAGSSLASALSATQSSLTLAAGTGARFKAGDVLRVPVSTYDPSQNGSTDDEQVLVLGVSGDTLSVQRGVNGTLAAGHTAGTAVRTAAQLAAGQGWLGQPSGAAVSLAAASATQVQNGDFETSGLAPWRWSVGGTAAGSLAQDAGTAASGSSSARITVSRAGAAWDGQLSQGGLSVVGGTSYTLSFWAKGSAGQQIMTTVQQTSAPYGVRAKGYYTLTGAWQRYTLTFTAAATEANLGAVFNLAGATGTIWVDAVRFSTGDPNLWRRDFTHGTVLVNGTSTAQTVTVGPGYRHIAGTQDPVTNNGATVSSVTIPAQDAVLLVKTS